jgi:transposase
MRPPRPLPPEAQQELMTLLEETHSKADYRRALCLWLRSALGLSASDIATALGWSTGSVHNLHSLYLRQGAAALAGMGRGGRKRELLTVEQEKALLSRFAFPAAQGGVAEAGAVRSALEHEIGHDIAKSTVYRLLARHGWRKLVPRPFHPDVLPETQAAFKKSFGAWCVTKPHGRRNAV